MKKKFKINEIVDFVIYFCIFTFMVIDFINNTRSEKSIIILITFLLIGLISMILFIKDEGFLTIDKMIYIFFWIFAYYTPTKQYISSTLISDKVPITDAEYLRANILILLFILIYALFRYAKIKWKKSLKPIDFDKNYIHDDFSITSKSLMFMLIISIICFTYLVFSNGIISLSKNQSENIDSFKRIFLNITRFFPVASLLIYIYSAKNQKIKCSKIYMNIFLSIIVIINIFLYFPINGKLSRYYLFAVYLIVFGSLLEKSNRKSYIILLVAVGFYFIFPAFNFFKYHTISEISKFKLGGFNANFIDYDAYQMFIMSIRFTETNGILWGANIITGLLCFIPRKIFKNKMYQSGQIVAEARGYSFTNLSCPLFAEFYLAGKEVFLIIGTILFAFIIKQMNKELKKNEILTKGLYYITMGMMLPLMRGSLLPMNIYLDSLLITYILCYCGCKIVNKNKV